MEKKIMLKEYFKITLFQGICAAALYFFMFPGGVVMGSVSGLCMVLANFIPLPISVMTLIINVLLLFLGIFVVGKEFGFKTIYTTCILSGYLYIIERCFPNFVSLTGDQIIDTICSVLILSLGQALLFHVNASSGGMDILAKIANKLWHVEIGTSIAVMGMAIVLFSAYVYDAKSVILGLLGTYANGIVVDYFISGFVRKKRVCILSEEREKIRNFIINDIKRGVTMYEAKGGYGGESKIELVTILNKNEYGKLMSFIQETDVTAFVTVSTVSEVVGSWRSRA